MDTRARYKKLIKSVSTIKGENMRNAKSGMKSSKNTPKFFFDTSSSWPWTRAIAISTLVLFGLAMFAVPAVAAEPSSKISKVKKVRKSSKKRVKRKSKRKRTSRRSGPYVEGGVGLFNLQDQPGNLQLQDGTGLSLGLGYRADKTLALEANFLATFHDILARDSSANGSGSDSASSTTMTGGTVNLKYFFPLAISRVEAYGRAGVGYISLDTPDNGEIAGPLVDLGGGIDYRVNKKLAIGGRGGYNLIFGENQQNNETADLSGFNLMLTVSYEL